MVTLQQLLKREIILKVISELKPSGSMLQAFYGMLPGQTAVMSKPGMDFGWDIFNNTRNLAKVRPPMSGPATRTRQRIGHVSARAVRLHDSIGIWDSEVYQSRPLGGNFGEVDDRGVGYVARQIKFLTELFRNAREFMVSRALMGGFSVTIAGEDMTLGEFGAGTFDVDMKIPASHKTDLDLGTGAGLITASWATAATDIVAQLGRIDAAFVRESGYTLRHIWMNGNTFFSTILQNTAIKNVGGTAFTIYEQFTSKTIPGFDGVAIDGGFDVVIRAWPHIRFHVYNQCLNLGAGTSVSATDSTPIIPNNKAILTPDPSPDWFGWIEGSDVIRETVASPARVAQGFDMWATPRIDPSGFDTKGIDIGLPAVFVPNAVAVATVVF